MSEPKPRGKKQPKHFKVHCSIQNHEKTAAMAADNDLLALYVRLGLLAVERFADRTGGTFIISDRELPRLTGKYRADVARTLLARLANVSPTSAERDGDVWRITIPNFAKKQGFAENKNRFRESPPSATATPTVEKRQDAPLARSGPPASPPDWRPLLNLLSTAEGEPDEKSAWLESEFPLIHAEAEADPKPNRIGPIAIRYYRNYLKGPRPFKGFSAKKETRRKLAEHEAECAAAMRELEEAEGFEAAHR